MSRVCVNVCLLKKQEFQKTNWCKWVSPLRTLIKYEDNQLHDRSYGRFWFAIFRREYDRHSYLHEMLYVCKILDPKLPVSTSGRYLPSAYFLLSAILLSPVACPELAGQAASWDPLSTLPLLMDCLSVWRTMLCELRAFSAQHQRHLLSFKG